jgi:hypothetical protein
MPTNEPIPPGFIRRGHPDGSTELVRIVITEREPEPPKTIRIIKDGEPSGLSLGPTNSVNSTASGPRNCAASWTP